MSKYYQKKVKLVNNIEVKVCFPIDEDADYRDRAERLLSDEKTAALLQKRLRNWWANQDRAHKTPFILIVEVGNKVVGKLLMSYIVSLTQIGIDKETETLFKEGVRKEVERIVNEKKYERDL